MKRLIIKIGGNLNAELKETFENPEKAKPNTHTLYLKDASELFEILSPKRLELLQRIIQCQSDRRTIGELASELKRKQEAISRDANFLAKYNLIQKIKEKQMVYLSALYGSLDIQLTSA